MSERQTIDSLVQSIDLVKRYSKSLLTDPDITDKTAIANDLGSYILHFSKAIEAHKFREKTFKEFVDMIDSSSEEADWDTVLSQFTEKLDRFDNSNKNPEQCAQYQNFMKFASELISNNEDELRVVSQTVNYIDPISKLPIVEPVKNKICGHVYEKDTILQFLNKKGVTKCPFAGCTASECVRKSDLVADNSLKRMLSNAANENAQKKLRISE